MSKSGLAGNERDLEQLVTLFKLLSDRTRLTILLLLIEGEMNVTALCEELKLSQPTVSHHLRLLRMNDVIGSRRNGKHVFYNVRGRVIGDGGGLAIPVENYTVRIGPKN